jgi:hypothetical protein
MLARVPQEFVTRKPAEINGQEPEFFLFFSPEDTVLSRAKTPKIRFLSAHSAAVRVT